MVDSFQRLKEKYKTDDHAESYRKRFTVGARKRSTGFLWRALRRAIGDGPKKILDVPCGTGRFSHPFAQAGYQVFGTDYSAQMLGEAAAQKNGNKVGFFRSDVRQLPFADQSFDVAVSVRFFHLLQPQERTQVMKELRRVAKEKIVVVYYPRHTVKQLTRWLRWKLGIIAQPRTRYYPWRKMEEEIKAAGLQVVEVVPACRWFIDDWVIVAK